MCDTNYTDANNTNETYRNTGTLPRPKRFLYQSPYRKCVVAIWMAITFLNFLRIGDWSMGSGYFWGPGTPGRVPDSAEPKRRRQHRNNLFALLFCAHATAV